MTIRIARYTRASILGALALPLMLLSGPDALPRLASASIVHAAGSAVIVPSTMNLAAPVGGDDMGTTAFGNKTDQPILINQIVVQPSQAPFHVPGFSSCIGQMNNKRKLPPPDPGVWACTFSVIFTPAAVGTYTAAVKIKYTGDDGTSAWAQLDVTGIAKATCTTRCAFYLAPNPVQVAAVGQSTGSSGGCGYPPTLSDHFVLSLTNGRMTLDDLGQNLISTGPVDDTGDFSTSRPNRVLWAAYTGHLQANGAGTITVTYGTLACAASYTVTVSPSGSLG